MQRVSTVESAAAPLASEFDGWDGTTGFDLGGRSSAEVNEWVMRKAAELIRINENMTKE
ncbi:hypothetical protein [Paenibacillus agricola]|uniref:Uncharacterized protein n=1 Tax=Paenibacillus agricola TaxID=2716264 RepID=A0ABX0J4U5_9BACL|nr:hypothetical protein [Paenibacillus agricola]NHN31157.1 hypothetical protein [Paenibacillus agricola]